MRSFLPFYSPPNNQTLVFVVAFRNKEKEWSSSLRIIFETLYSCLAALVELNHLMIDDVEITIG